MKRFKIIIIGTTEIVFITGLLHIQGEYYTIINSKGDTNYFPRNRVVILAADKI